VTALRRFVPTAVTSVALGMLAVAAALVPAPPARADYPTRGWNVNCPYSHSKKDDPIVYPGQPGASHLHDFFAATTTDAFSTYKKLRQSPTTCSSIADTAAYWSPALVLGTETLVPDHMFSYYRVPKGEAPEDVQSFPKSLRMIAGDSKAPGPQHVSIVYYTCSDASGAPKLGVPFNCAQYPGSHVQAHIIFPSCWDGVRLDSENHKDHMAYPTVDEGCPTTHRVVLPKVSMSVGWPIVNGTGAKLASGEAYTLHGDFVNAWDQGRLDQLVADCINAGPFCGIIHDE
jgi:hypothetical protein